ncbi:hypothetical protein BH24CHL4_BH24CHL4_26530 [soil metagenome]
MLECKEWGASYDHRPPGPATLIVAGMCMVPGGATTELVRAEPQGIVRSDLMLVLNVNVPYGEAVEPGVATRVAFEEETETDYSTVTISSKVITTGKDTTIAVQHAH